MAIVRKNELMNISLDDLNKKLTELRKELIKLNAQISMGTTPESPGKIKLIKKTIAKLKMFINEKERQEVIEKV